MDRVYTHAMLAGMSQDADNRQRLAPEVQSVPWVARYLPEAGNKEVPILSRQRYREILRHVWLRGADSMQIFNALAWPQGTIATEEVEDAVAIYDEMLAYRRFLEEGWIMNTDVPGIRHDGPVWSGLRLEKEAVVRAFTQAEHPVKFTIAPWDQGPTLELVATPTGTTYYLDREKDRIKVERRQGGP